MIDAPDEYVEIRGPANQSLEGVFLISVQGNDREAFEVGRINSEHIIDLSSASIGSNGFLTIVDNTGPSAHSWPVAAGTTIVSTDGLDFANASYTVFLIHVSSFATAPVTGQHLDSGGNGLDALPPGWTILDGVSVLDGGRDDRGYASAVFSSDGDGETEFGVDLIETGFDVSHVMRVGNSTGSTAADWLAFDHDGTAPNYTIAGSTSSAYTAGSLITNHLGAVNPTGTTAALTVTISQSVVAENGGSTTGTVSRGASTSGALTIHLTSDDPAKATVPTSMTIPDGLSSATFTISGIDDAIADGTQTVTVRATAAGHSEGSGTVDVTDDDLAGLTMQITAASISENGGTTTATVSRNSSTNSPLTVTLTSSDPGELTVPATVTIAAGQTTSAPFDISSVDDAIVDRTQTVSATATATAHAASADTLDITDNDTAVADLSVTQHGNEEGHLNIVYTVTPSRTNHTGEAITFNLDDLFTGTATSGDDYTAIDALAFISVAAGDNSGTYTVAVADDFLPEAAETVVAQITYSSDANVTIGTDSATASIADNDAGRTPGNVTAVVSGSNLTVTGDAGDNGISVSTNTAGDIVVTGVGGTTVNGAADFTAFAAAASTLPGNLTVNGLGGRDLISVSNVTVTVTGRTLLYGGDDLDAIEVINTNVNGNLLVMEQAGDGFIDLSGGIFAGVVQLLTGEGDNQVTVANADFRNVLQLTAGTGNDQITLHAVSVTSSTQINSGSGNDSIQLNDTNHLSTLYITADAGNDTITGQGVAVTATTYMNTGSGNDTVDFDGLHAKSVAILILGADHDAARFLNSRFDNVVNMPVTAGNNVMDLQNTTFNGPTYVQTSGGALAARIRNNTFNSNVFITGGPGNTDILLDDLTSTFAVTRGVSGFEDLTNTFINESFQTLPELAFS